MSGPASFSPMVVQDFPLITLEDLLKYEDTAFLQGPPQGYVIRNIPQVPQYLTMEQVNKALSGIYGTPDFLKEAPIPQKKRLVCPEHGNQMVPEENLEKLVCTVVGCTRVARKKVKK